MVRGTDDTAAAHELSWYASALWDGLEGWACLALGGGPHLVDGRYQHESFEHRFYRWPKQAQKITSVALEAAATHDLWACPMLRSERLRRVGTGVGGRHLWADVDRPLAGDAIDLVDRLVARSGSFRVASGSEGHQHLYVRLHEQAPPDLIVELNRRLAATIGGDSKWDETSLLRLPGTRNHKARAAGGRATPVRLIKVQP